MNDAVARLNEDVAGSRTIGMRMQRPAEHPGDTWETRKPHRRGRFYTANVGQ
jgi:hypothetical protein